MRRLLLAVAITTVLAAPLARPGRRLQVRKGSRIPAGQGRRGVAFPRHRPRPDERPHLRHRGPSHGSGHLVRGRRLGRGLEDHQRRHHLDADFRGPALVLDRRDHSRSHQSRRGLGGHRRERQRAPCRLGGRGLPQPRWRAHLAADGPSAVGAHRPHPGGPARWQPGSRGRRGAALGGGRGARRLSVQRWRRHVDPGASDRREHRRHRSRIRSRPIRMWSMPRPTSAGATSGGFSAAGRARGSGSPSTTARPGAS